MTNATDRTQGPWVAVGILTACYATAIADRLVVGLLVGPIKTDLSLTDFQMSLILGPAFAVSYAFLSLPFGRLADLVTRRNLIVFSIAAWSGFTILCGLASSFAVMLAARVGTGAGEAGLNPAAYSILADRFTGHRLGRAIGIYLMGGVVGNAAVFIGGGALYAVYVANGPLALPMVGALAPWQLTLLTLGAFGLPIALLARVGLREPVRMNSGQKPGIGMVATEAMRPAFIWLFAAYAAMSVIVYGYIGWLPAYLERTFALSVSDTGKYIGLIVLAGGFAGPLAAGWLADLWRGARVSSPMRLAMLFAIVLGVTSFLTFQATALSVVLTGCLIVSVVTSGMLVLVPLTIQLLSGSHMRGHMTGLALLIGNVVGQGLGPTSVAALSSPPFGLSLAGAMASVFCAAAVVCGVGALCAYRTSPPVTTQDK